MTDVKPGASIFKRNILLLAGRQKPSIFVFPEAGDIKSMKAKA